MAVAKKKAPNISFHSRFYVLLAVRTEPGDEKEAVSPGAIKFTLCGCMRVVTPLLSWFLFRQFPQCHISILN